MQCAHFTILTLLKMQLIIQLVSVGQHENNKTTKMTNKKATQGHECEAVQIMKESFQFHRLDTKFRVLVTS